MVPSSKIIEFCRYYKDDSTVRKMLAFETGMRVPLSRITKLRPVSERQPSHTAYLNDTNYGSDGKNMRWAEMMENGSRSLALAIARDHPERVLACRKKADPKARPSF